MSADTWPEDCPQCHAPWRVKSRTMGAAHGQPHHGTCTNGHIWYEDAKEAQDIATGLKADIIIPVDGLSVYQLRQVIVYLKSLLDATHPAHPQPELCKACEALGRTSV